MRLVPFADLESIVGQEVGVSPWHQITQSQVNKFAEATGDHQWIHVDVERATKELGAPIAHGYLTLSLLPHMMMETLDVQGGRMSINYGLNRVRFAAPVRAGDRIRARFTLAALEDFAGGIQLTWHALVEIEGQHKPACVAEMIARRYI